MDNINSILAVLTGILLRLALPIGVTGAFVYLLTRLDKRWQAEAAPAVEAAMPKNSGCWDMKHCSTESIAHCTAYAHPETPCWQHFRRADGLLQERCLGCDVFKKAPVPVTG